MNGFTQAYQQLKPCIDSRGHQFAVNYVGMICCTRCGMRPEEARR